MDNVVYWVPIRTTNVLCTMYYILCTFGEVPVYCTLRNKSLCNEKYILLDPKHLEIDMKLSRISICKPGHC